MKTGMTLISRERQEQQQKHGFTLEHDLQYKENELIQAACFCLNPEWAMWPPTWDKTFKDKILQKSEPERKVIAGAFIAASLDVDIHNETI